MTNTKYYQVQNQYNQRFCDIHISNQGTVYLEKKIGRHDANKTEYVDVTVLANQIIYNLQQVYSDDEVLDLIYGLDIFNKGKNEKEFHKK